MGTLGARSLPTAASPCLLVGVAPSIEDEAFRSGEDRARATSSKQWGWDFNHHPFHTGDTQFCLLTGPLGRGCTDHTPLSLVHTELPSHPRSLPSASVPLCFVPVLAQCPCFLCEHFFYCFGFCYCFRLHWAACGLLVPQPGSNSCLSVGSSES